jgi:hypothetical protein
MSDLHLHVKTEYFEAIKRGEKTEEYRLKTPYWIKRLFYFNIERYRDLPKRFRYVVIYNAYKSGDENRLYFPWQGWDMKTITHKHFGSEPVTVFAIKLEK